MLWVDKQIDDAGHAAKEAFRAAVRLIRDAKKRNATDEQVIARMFAALRAAQDARAKVTPLHARLPAARKATDFCYSVLDAYTIPHEDEIDRKNRLHVNAPLPADVRKRVGNIREPNAAKLFATIDKEMSDTIAGAEPGLDEIDYVILREMAKHGHALKVADLSTAQGLPTETTCKLHVNRLITAGYARRVSPRGGAVITKEGRALLT